MTTPTSDIDENSHRISDKSELVEYFEAGNKPRSDWRIGTEHEKFGFIRDGLRPLPYEGEASVLAILEGLRDRFGWQPIIEAEKLIGLNKAVDIDRKTPTRPAMKWARICEKCGRSPTRWAWPSWASAPVRSGALRKRRSCRRAGIAS